MPTPNLYVYQETSIDFTPFLTKWIPYSSKFLTAGSTMLNKGRFEIFQVERDKITKLSSDDCPNPIRCGTFDFSGCNESKIAFGCTDGSLEIRDMRSNRAAEFSKNVSKSPINCIDAAGDKSSGAGLKEIATGYKDGSICVWDPRVQDPVIELRPETDIGDPLSECWAIAFGNSHSSDGR
ncbi:MAG: WD repeat-containing protein 92 [Marteilia pararefringens]